MLFSNRFPVALVGALACMSQAALAAVTVTIEDPGVVSANPAIFGSGGSKTETFDGAATGGFTNYSSGLGTYSAGTVSGANVFGGAGATNFITTQDSPGTLLTLTEQATYFGFWWSAGSVGNSVELLSGGFSIFSFSIDDVLDFLDNEVANSDAYFGNPNDAYLGQVDWEPFLFINMFSDSPFDAVRLSGPDFESDNHTVSDDVTQQSGTDIAPVPVPATLPLLVASLGALGWGARRAKSAASAR